MRWELMEDRKILYFVKYPEPGKVKTRLSKDIGDIRAADLYRKVAERNLTVLAEGDEPFHLVVAFDPSEKETAIRDWLRPFQITDYLPQKGERLGDRLDQAFQYAFRGRSKGAHFQRVLALGSDTLGLSPEIINEAFDALESFDVVIGPARDGGYYLIGLSFQDEGIFTGIPWSTSEVYATTVQYLEREQLSYYRLPVLEDLDDKRNLKEVLQYEAIK